MVPRWLMESIPTKLFSPHVLWLFVVNPLTLAIVVLISDTFDNNSQVKNDFTKYLKGSGWYCSEKYFSFKYFPKYAFASKILSNLSGCFWPL